ncbi:hypothetical protein BX070DRAFT_130512 [Coemansia spiralis]|nr:hypothetical protein BX070DRAFT_130512 [Coemansia spiralis]
MNIACVSAGVRFFLLKKLGSFVRCIGINKQTICAKWCAKALMQVFYKQNPALLLDNALY